MSIERTMELNKLYIEEFDTIDDAFEFIKGLRNSIKHSGREICVNVHFDKVPGSSRYLTAIRITYEGE